MAAPSSERKHPKEGRNFYFWEDPTCLEILWGLFILVLGLPTKDNYTTCSTFIPP